MQVESTILQLLVKPWVCCLHHMTRIFWIVCLCDANSSGWCRLVFFSWKTRIWCWLSGCCLIGGVAVGLMCWCFVCLCCVAIIVSCESRLLNNTLVDWRTHTITHTSSMQSIAQHHRWMIQTHCNTSKVNLWRRHGYGQGRSQVS